MKLKPDAYFLMFLVLLGLVGIIESLTFQYFQSIFLPLLMSGVIFVLALIELVRQIRERTSLERHSETKPPSPIPIKIQWQRFGIALSWIAGLALAIYLFGFLMSIPVFVFCYYKKSGRGWLAAAGLAVIITAVVYGVFEVGLKSPLYRGILYFYGF